MATALTVHDEGTSGGRIRSFRLQLASSDDRISDETIVRPIRAR